MTELDYKANMFLTFLSSIDEKKYYFIVEKTIIEYIIDKILSILEDYKQNLVLDYGKAKTMIDASIKSFINYVESMEMSPLVKNNENLKGLYEDFLEKFEEMKRIQNSEFTYVRKNKF